MNKFWRNSSVPLSLHSQVRKLKPVKAQPRERWKRGGHVTPCQWGDSLTERPHGINKKKRWLLLFFLQDHGYGPFPNLDGLRPNRLTGHAMPPSTAPHSSWAVRIRAGLRIQIQLQEALAAGTSCLAHQARHPPSAP